MRAALEAAAATGAPGQARARAATIAVALLTLTIVFGAGYSVVRASSFSGWDEWLVIDLTSRGIVSLPFENRPFALLFNLPGSLLTPNGLAGFWVVHGLYLWSVGVVALALASRLAPGRPLVALTAAVVSACWAPRDLMRLDPVLISNYSGAAAGSALAALLLLESSRRRSWIVFAVGVGLGFVTMRALESTAGLVVAAPLLLWAAPAAPVTAAEDHAGSRAGRRFRRAASATWLAVASVAVGLAAAPLLPGRQASYQVNGLGFDPAPGRVAARVLRQLWFELGPALSPVPSELLESRVALAALVFVGGGVWLARRSSEASPLTRRTALRLALTGLVAMVLAFVVLAQSRAIVGPDRMQLLPALGVGLFAAGLAALMASPLPARWRTAAALGFGAYLAAVGTGRTLALQREWRGIDLWPQQRASLVGLTRAAPGLLPGTLVLLLDDGGAWPAGFSFRHALRYLYGAQCVGAVWGAEPFLYPLRRVPTGFVVAPDESIRAVWHSPVSHHAFEQLVVVLSARDGQVRVLDEWPTARLAPLPAGAVYAPRSRITPPAERPQRRVLAGEGGT